jgi:hypothetical protein
MQQYKDLDSLIPNYVLDNNIYNQYNQYDKYDHCRPKIECVEQCPPPKIECVEQCPPPKIECVEQCPQPNPCVEQCPPKIECVEQCPPKNPGDKTYEWSWLGALILWFIIFTVLFWLIFYSLKPNFVLQTNSTQIDTSKVLLSAIISSLILVIVIWLIKTAVSRKYKKCQ